MHECSLVAAVLERARAECAARGAARVVKVALRAGALAVDPSLLRTAWEVLRAGTCCAAATLEIASKPMGTELVLETLELEVPDVHTASS